MLNIVLWLLRSTDRRGGAMPEHTPEGMPEGAALDPPLADQAADKPRDPVRDEWQLRTLLSEYTALRQEISGLLSSSSTLVVLGFTAVGTIVPVAINQRVTVLLITLPAIILVLGAWALVQLYLLLYDGIYVSMLERRINKLMQLQVMDWNTIWSAARSAAFDKVTHTVEFRKGVKFGRFPFALFGIIVLLLFISAFAVLIVLGVQEIQRQAGLHHWQDLGEWAVRVYVALGVISDVALPAAFAAVPWYLNRQLKRWERFYELKHLEGREVNMHGNPKTKRPIDCDTER